MTGVACREYVCFNYQPRKSWSRARRVIGKAEQLFGKSNPRFIVTNLPEDYATPDALYEKLYCVRGQMENRIKEQQLDLFADRTSTHTMRANQLRLWFSSMACILMNRLRSTTQAGTEMARATHHGASLTCGTIRLKLFKIAVSLKVSLRQVLLHMSDDCPFQEIFVKAGEALQGTPRAA